ncbi:M20 metallopeptidase family protein [Paenibacillus cymbidii]|uniref:M20 metallopeptidase family protein n=1 Tax=Paenibacillus cymbidii TaxID=1639034 RepID=UPI00108026B2|nr:amidohydrolase [Paenibacillus cymbidii]
MIEEETGIRESVKGVNMDVITWRRHLHENPELSFQETKTSQYVYDILQSFGNLELSRPTQTSVMARLIGAKPGRVLALRADMDALPILEETNLPFASKNFGVMHACGHDAHTAILLGAAKVLTNLKKQIHGEIRFLFQHAEELIPGGAQEMVSAGVLGGVDAVLGLHVSSQVPTGLIGINDGPILASMDAFKIVIQGQGGHASTPHQCKDPVAVAAQLITGINHIVSRKIDSAARAVISVTQMQGSDAPNIIPDKASIGGTVRTFDPDIREQIPQWIEQYAKGLTEANECSYEMDYLRGHSAVINDHQFTSFVKKNINRTFGDERRYLLKPIMGSEDFSAFSNVVPGCFVFLGAGSINNEENYPHHHPKFMINEQALESGVELFVTTALDFSRAKDPETNNSAR